ncbi:MAG: ArnT family glycosyltransferase [Candidatus Komeilibacteria bacterium]
MKALSKIRQLDNYLAVLCLLALVFFGIYSYLSYATFNGGNIIFNSPDETANYWAANTFYNNGNFTEFSDTSLYAGDITAPRSLRIIDNYLVPTGFLGMPWFYGMIAKLFGSSSIIPFLTPFFAALAVIFFYLSLRFLFSEKASFLSASLLLLHPAFWYYATRSMMPNVLFLSLLIIGIYFFLKAIYKERNIWYIVSGILVGLSLMVRAAEIVWVLPLFVLLCLYYFKKINWTSVWLTPVFTIAGMLPMFYYNNILFGQVFSLGYQLAPGVNISNFNWLPYLLPFGFNIAVIKLHVLQYFRDIFNWHYILTIIGFVLIFISLYKSNKKYRLRLLAFLILLAVISGILVIYYGSWQFSDNPNPKAVTIGTSFVRYWLPIYILLLPLIAIPISRLFRKSTLAWSLICISILIVVAGFSYKDVYQDKQEGILAIKNTINNYQLMSDTVVQNTEDNAVIIAKKSDKVFFPKRTVIYDLFYDVDYERVAELVEHNPVYLWDWQHDEAAVSYINTTYYNKFNLEAIPLDVMYNNMRLYSIQNVNR